MDYKIVTKRTFACSSVALVMCKVSLAMQKPEPAGTITNVLKNALTGGTLCPVFNSLNIPVTVRQSICG
jgi:hypothetical protein